jgi:hypothetical protein
MTITKDRTKVRHRPFTLKQSMIVRLATKSYVKSESFWKQIGESNGFGPGLDGLLSG